MNEPRERAIESRAPGDRAVRAKRGGGMSGTAGRAGRSEVPGVRRTAGRAEGYEVAA